MDDPRKRDMTILVETLQSIWNWNSTKVIVALLIVGLTVGGMVTGALWASRDVLARTSGVIDSLQREVDYNRTVIKGLEERQIRNERRYRDMLTVLEAVRQKKE